MKQSSFNTEDNLIDLIVEKLLYKKYEVIPQHIMDIVLDFYMTSNKNSQKYLIEKIYRHHKEFIKKVKEKYNYQKKLYLKGSISIAEQNFQEGKLSISNDEGNLSFVISE